MTKRLLLLAAAAGVSLATVPAGTLAQNAPATLPPVDQAPPVEPPPAPPADTSGAAAPDSGVLVAPPQKRIPLDQFMIPRGCDDLEEGEICVTGDPYEEPEEVPPPEPGDRALDVPAEREALSTLGANTPDTCNSVGIGGSIGCTYETYDNWKKERELLKARTKNPVDD